MQHDVVVVGGGVVGLAIALRLRADDFTVTVVDQGSPGLGASARAGGVLSPLLDAAKPDTLLGLLASSLLRWPAYLEEWGLAADVGWRPGVLVVGEDARHWQEMLRLLPSAQQVDPGVRAVSPGDIRTWVPGIAPTVEGGLYYPGAAALDAVSLYRGMQQRALERGVVMRWGLPVLGIEWGPGRVRGVNVAGQVVPGGVVVVAAGAWSGHLLANAGAVLPVIPVRGSLLAVDGIPAPPIPVFGRGRHVIPRRDGMVLVGGTEERAGFQDGVSLDAVRRLGEAVGLYPPLEGARVRDLWSGFRPKTPDGLPAIGWWPDREGLYVATGHYKNGLLAAAITADAVAAALADEDLPLNLAPFRPERFQQADWPDWVPH